MSYPERKGGEMVAAVDSTFSTVSSYVGFITGIAGIVLSIVAIVFAVVVQKDANRVNDQTIKTLAKIEADVNRLSSDTGSLIKAAWDKMLDGGRPSASDSSQDSLAIVGDNVADKPARDGFMLEATKNILENGKNLESAADKAALVLKQLEKLSDDMQVRSVAAGSKASRPASQVEEMVGLLRMTEPVDRELLRIILRRGHLTVTEFDQLNQKGATRKGLATLRALGILVPLSGHGGHDENGRVRDPKLVYWIRPSMVEGLRAAIVTAPRDEGAYAIASRALESVGYRVAGK
ncbi:hypothetical protein AB0E55_00490 [Amycolatopsis keratiniphila]|uniref:hypothetical protein n=1 Tax=Amycolatopsis keratiniphila TaxID=129921 RepID=UPI0033F93919